MRLSIQGRVLKFGIYLLNEYKEPTVLCNMEMDTYPPDENIMAALEKSGRKGYVIKATERAREIGGSLLTNVVMLGARCHLSSLLDSREVRRVLPGRSPTRLRAQNPAAFDDGGLLLVAARCRS